jgi:hypothetical protein
MTLTTTYKVVKIAVKPMSLASIFSPPYLRGLCGGTGREAKLFRSAGKTSDRGFDSKIK